MTPKILALLAALVASPEVPCQAGPTFQIGPHMEESTIVCMIVHKKGESPFAAEHGASPPEDEDNQSGPNPEDQPGAKKRRS